MPQGISDFTRAASGLPDATPLRVEHGQVTQATYKRGVTRAENMQANTETATAFLRAVRTHPSYARGGAEVEARLNNKIEKGLPLCADEVRSIVRQLNGQHARAMGDRLEHAGILPEGTAAGFARHALTSFGSWEGEHSVRASVRDFLIRQVIPNNIEKMTKFDSVLEGQPHLPLSVAEEQQIQKGLAAYHGASDVKSYVKTLLIKNIADGLQIHAPEHAEFGKGMAGLAEIGASNLFAQANREEIRLLAALPQDSRTTVLANPDLLRTLLANQHTLTIAEQVDLARYVSVNLLPLNNSAEQATVMRDFLLMQSALYTQKALPLGLPENLSRPLMFNPEVRHKAIATLQAGLAPGSIPTRAQVDAALLQARDDFVQDHAPQLNEFLQMAMDPPAGLALARPLTLQTLPGYLNVLLSGDEVFEPLFNDSRPVDADYLQSVLLYNKSVESYGDVVGGGMALDDANVLHEGAMALLMARRGVGETEYPAIMERGLARLGHVINELNTLSGQCFNQGNDAAQRDVLTLRRVLSSTLVNTAQQLTPANRAALSLPADSGDMLNVLLSPFDREVDLKEFSSQMHEFATSLGIQLPPSDSAAATEVKKQHLFEANNKIAGSTLARILGDGTQRLGITVPFSELASDLIAELHLNDMNAALLEPKFFMDNASKLLHEKAAEATSQDKTLDAGTLRDTLRQSMATDLIGLHSLMAQIDALPKPSHLTEAQHAEQKRVMKEIVHMHPVTDPGVLSRLMEKAADVNNAVHLLRAPQATPQAVATAISALANAYANAASTIDTKAMPPQHVAMPCFLDMALRAARLDAKSAANVQGNTIGEAGKSVAASCKFVLDSNTFTPQQKVMPQLVRDLTSHLATMATVLAEGRAEHNPVRFTQQFKHISEIPAGCVSTVVPFSTVLQQKLNLMARRLSPAEWDMLERTGNALLRNMTKDTDRLADILANNASSILKAARAKGNPKSLTLDQVATAVLGSRLTSTEKKNGTSDGERLCNAFVSRYTKNVRNCIPHIQAESITSVLDMGMKNGFSFPLLNELARPDGRLTQDNVPPELLRLGGLDNYTKENAFGLKEGFPQQNEGYMHVDNSSITFNDAAGNVTAHSLVSVNTLRLAFSPETWMSEVDKNVLQPVIADASRLAPSDAQMRRIMQLISQSGRNGLTQGSQAFYGNAGREVAPDLRYTITPAEDNSIEVSMESLLYSRMNIKHTILVGSDGSYKTTEFLMHR